jgi:hypothetical protein
MQSSIPDSGVIFIMKNAEFYHFKPILVILIILCLASACKAAGTKRGIHLDTDQDYIADEVITIAAGLNMPNGVAFLMMQDGSLLVSDDRAGVIYRIAYGE